MKRIILTNTQIGVEQVKGLAPSKNGGEPEAVDMWTLFLVDRDTVERYDYTMTREVRDELVRQLTGGIVLAGGELPKI